MFTFFSLFLLWLLSIVIEQMGLFCWHAIISKRQFSGVHAVVQFLDCFKNEIRKLWLENKGLCLTKCLLTGIQGSFMWKA